MAVLSRKIGAKTGTKEAGQLCLSDPGLLVVTSPRGPYFSHQMSPNSLQLYTTLLELGTHRTPLQQLKLLGGADIQPQEFSN